MIFRKRIKRYNDYSTGEFREIINYVDRMYSSRGYVYRCKNNYIRVFTNNEIPEGISKAVEARFYLLSKYTVKSSQLLGEMKHGKRRAYKIKEISELLDISEKTCRKFMAECISKGLIKEVEIYNDKYYAINPIYVVNGKYITVETYYLFEEELKKELPNWVIMKLTSDMIAVGYKKI